MNDWREWGLLSSMLIVAVMWVQVPQWADDIPAIENTTVMEKLQEQ